MNLSQTQLMNYATMLTSIVMLSLTTFGVTAEEDKIKFIIFAGLTLGFSVYNFYQRFKKGDLTLGGIRK